jgi:hypothetical protein
MAGVKGKSGAKKGQGKGVVKNPCGRPAGAQNKVSASVKSRIAAFIANDFDSFISDITGLDERDRVKAKIELMKFFIPRPLNEEETESHQLKNEVIKRMMGEK